MAFECMEDCIHLKACRRIQKIAKSKWHSIPRYCTEDCSAYISGDTGNYIDVDTAIKYARNGVSSIQGGYDSYDVYCSCDLHGETLAEIIAESEE